MLGTLLRRVGARLRSSQQDSELQAYLRNGRRPWSRGYDVFKQKFINECLRDADLLKRFTDGRPLPSRFGEFLDERVVEYPWLFARLDNNGSRLLDAGSALNHAYLLTLPILQNKSISIVTLAPETECHWRRGVSYLFGDLRDLPFRDGYFDEVVCISTLEHVGKDNARLYTSRDGDKENAQDAFMTAARELARVCKPGGLLAITLPFGRFVDYGWYQQFDGRLLDQLCTCFTGRDVRAMFFRYADGGWQRAAREECADCVGFDIHATRYMNSASTRDYAPDFAAASRAIVALEIRT